MRPSGIVSEEEQTVVKETVRIDWRKLLRLSLMIMVLPTVSAILLDMWFKTVPYITIIAIIICFPAATILVVRSALSEMDRVIAEVAPPHSLELEVPMETEVTPEVESGVKSSPTS
jgi:hypothetical protein